MTHPNYLDTIIKKKQEEVARLLTLTSDRHHPLHAIQQHARTPSRTFSRALRSKGLSVIAEIKRRSPSAGTMCSIDDPVALACAYCHGGANAISVLTDATWFGGSLEDLRAVSVALAEKYPEVPTMRKDFIIHPIQLAEAALAGAAAVLLITCIVGDALASLIEEATFLGLETLTEVHTEEEIECAIKAKCPIIGLNHRNLTTFVTDIGLSDRLRPRIPNQIITVAESGIHEASQAHHMRRLGYDAILLGEALVRSPDPGALVTLMKGEQT